MRILVANAHGKVVGGVETYLQAVLPALGQRGHQVALAVESSMAGGTGLHVAPSGAPTWSVSDEGLTAVVKSARRFNPHVIYIHQLSGDALDSAIGAAAPALRFVHGYNLTCVSGTKHHRSPGLQSCEVPLGPGCLFRYFPRRCGGLDPRTLFRQYRARAGKATRLAGISLLAVASEHMARELARNGVPPEAIRVLPLFPPGVDRDPAPSAGPAGPPSHLLFVGRMTRAKGVHLLPGALAQAAGALGRTLSLEVAGSGPAREALLRAAVGHRVPVHDLGWLGPEAKLAALRRASLLVVPSVWPEPFGLVGPEAGCVGLPAVAFAVGGIPEWLTPGVTGELAPASPPTEAGLADAIVRAVGSGEHYARLRTGAWEMAGRYTADTHLARLEAILETDVTARLRST